VTELTAADFPAFFRAVYGYDPFPWQARLAEHVNASGWPAVMDLPTASGKTACLDVAVFAMALRRQGPRRVFFVVDRRVVVDAAFDRMVRLAQVLREAQDGVPRCVADRLREMGKSDEPLFVYQMRGGIYRDDSWVRSPLQPTLIASTVDQVGSRLLFRGYGVGDKALPIHAALAANDALILLDEAHCARPFSEVLASVERYRRWAETDLQTPFAVVEMTATPVREVASRFELGEADYTHPEMRQRLEAAKPARLVVSKARPKEWEKYAGDLEAEALRMAEKPGLRRIAILVNRVKTARLVYQRLRDGGQRVHLLIGRMRAVDRAELPGDLQAMLSGQKRMSEGGPVFVVATQCLEVGADLDFDAIVTECASIDALLQRFGRLDRIGVVQKAGVVSEGCIVAASYMTNADYRDAVYGNALAQTWRWLEGLGPLDFGIHSAAGGTVRARLAALEDRSAMQRANVATPVLLPAHLDALVQTAPRPAIEPDVSLFLHGKEAGPPEVQVVWRGDLDAEDTDYWAEFVGLCPPVAAEAMPVTLRDLRRWLLGGEGDSGATDVEGVDSGGAEPQDAELRSRVLLWKGEESFVLRTEADLGRIEPGSTLVLPVASGGWNELGHVPEGALADAAEQARLDLRRASVLRLHQALIGAWPENEGRAAILDEIEKEEVDLESVLAALRECAAGMRWLGQMLDQKGRPSLEKYPGEKSVGWVLVWAAVEADAGNDESSKGAPVFLDRHLEDVAAEVRMIAGELVNGGSERASLGRAAELHDCGKADVRFQAMLRGGDLLAAQFAPRLLAKGRAWGRGREESGLPKGFRHEMLSLLLAMKEKGLDGDDLALHLIASHHGWSRPFAPVVEDQGVEVAFGDLRISAMERVDGAAHRLDSGVADRFWVLTRRYGWWGLAWFEALLRLGDWEASRKEAGLS